MYEYIHISPLGILKAQYDVNHSDNYEVVGRQILKTESYTNAIWAKFEAITHHRKCRTAHFSFRQVMVKEQ